METPSPRPGAGESDGAKGPADAIVPHMKILVIEDDLEAAAYMTKAFREAGIVADHASDGDSGLFMGTENSYDVMVIDRMLPRRDGLSVISELGKRAVNTPVLILSALGQVDDRVTGLRAGADDYLPKPYAFSELLARVEVLGRRKGAPEQDMVYRVGDLELDRLSHEVRRAGKEILLQPREFRLLEYLMKNAGQVVTRTMLLEHVWDYHFDPQTNVIDVHVSRLRSKLDKAFDNPLLKTIPGAGYMIKDEGWACAEAASPDVPFDRRQAVGALYPSLLNLRRLSRRLCHGDVGAHPGAADAGEPRPGGGRHPAGFRPRRIERHAARHGAPGAPAGREPLCRGRAER